MHTQLYGLQIDFVTRNGHFMVLSAVDGLRREELSDFQVNMLLANKIPQLLELQIEELDQQIKLYYNITGKRMLTHWLRLESLTIHQFFNLLYRIVDTVASSNIYMLQEGRYVLKEDYIYCSEDWNDIYLTYVPKETLSEKNSVSADLQHLASRLVHKVTELSGNGYQELMNYLLDESFNLPVLRQLLLKHMNHSSDTSGHSNRKAMNDPAENTFFRANVPIEGQKVKLPSPERPSWISANAENVPPVVHKAEVPAEKPYPSPIWTSAAQSPLDPQPDVQSEDDPPSLSGSYKKLKLPVLLIGFLGLCLVWKLYLDRPVEAWLWVCSGLSLLIADLVFIVLWIWKPTLNDGDEEDDTGLDFWNNGAGKGNAGQFSAPSAGDGVAPFFIHKEELLIQTGPQEAPAAQPESRLESKLAARLPDTSASLSDSYYRNLEQRTTLLAPPDATVLLGSLSAEPAGSMRSAAPYLEWTRAGAVKKAQISKAVFVIGRPGSRIDLAHDEEGTSRIHAEIVHEDKAYWIKDLGSRNGTFVNGEILVPYRMYSLKEGDIVKIINTDYTFKMGL